MKRFIPVLIAVILVLSMSVPSFAAITPTVYGLTKEGDNIRIGTFETSKLTVDQKDFMRRWFTDTEHAVLVYCRTGNSSWYADYYEFILLREGSTFQVFTSSGSNPSSRIDWRVNGWASHIRFGAILSDGKVVNFVPMGANGDTSVAEKSSLSGDIGGWNNSPTDRGCILTRNAISTGSSNVSPPFIFPSVYQYNYSGELLIDMDENLKPAPPVTKHDLTINYQYANGDEAVGTYSGSFDEGTTYDIPSPVISGYVPDKISVIGTMPGTNVTETVTYNKKKATLTIKYLYGDGSEAAPTYVGEYDVGEVASVTSPVIAGYNPDISVITHTMFDGANHATVVYRENTPPVSSSEPSSSEDSSSGGSSSDTAEKYDLTIDYQKPDGTDLAGAYKAELAEGETYNVPSPTINGYVPDRYSVFGTMPSRAVTEKVVYAQGSGGGVSGNPYVPWNVGLLYTAVGNLRSSIGVAFDIGIWIFMLVTGLYVVMKIVNSIGQ